MPLFLNTPKLNEWLPKLIATSEKELIFVVPYIKISKNIFKALKKADENGVAVTIVYRENKLSDIQKQKILGLKKINLLHHPNIHCKCYYNGKILIIGSMNLYEYSEQNNREMGVLFHRYEREVAEKLGLPADREDSKIFYDTIFELKEIVKSASLEHINNYYKDNGFTIEILKTNKEKAEETCEVLNEFSLNKKFSPKKLNEYYYSSTCKNYYDNIDVTLEGKRVLIEFNLPDLELKNLFKTWDADRNWNEFSWYKCYWNYYKGGFYLYLTEKIEVEDLAINERFDKFRKGIKQVIEKYRKITGK